MDRLILASTSPYRRSLLERLGLPFTTESPRVDERLIAGEPARRAVARLAEAKARAGAKAHPHALVIGSDQLAVLHGELLGKPGSPEAAVAQLERASGQQIEFFTAVCVLQAPAGEARTRVVENRVRFRSLNRAAIEAYVRRDHPIDCTGAFKAEGLGIALFESIEGPDPTALVGLPLIALCDLLEEAGLEVLSMG